MNPLQTPLLILGSCCPEDFPEYERYFNATDRSGPVVDRFGRRVTFLPDRAHHVCFANPRHDEGKNMSRPVWRADRAQRIPWIMVALTHSTSVLKESKEPGKQVYLIAMQVIESSGLTREYYQVVVEPRKGGTEAKLITAYPLRDQEWWNAKKMKNVRVNIRTNQEAGDISSPAS